MEERPLTLTRNITGGLPPFRLPDFTYHNGNRTIEFPELLEALGSGLAVVPLMAFLESVAIAKAFGRPEFSSKLHCLEANQISQIPIMQAEIYILFRKEK